MAFVNYTTSYPDQSPKIRIFDYGTDTIKHVMGVNSTTTTSSTSQQITESSLQTSTMSSSCINDNCSIQYAQDQDRLYFSEGSKLRYITNPEDPSHHTLIDLFNATATIDNFTISPDRKYAFYLKSGKL